MNKGASCADISQILNVSRQKVFYWAKHDIKTSRINRRKKLPEEYYQKIINLAKNAAANSLSSRKICAIINAELEQKNILGHKLNNKSTINIILNVFIIIIIILFILLIYRIYKKRKNNQYNSINFEKQFSTYG